MTQDFQLQTRGRETDKMETLYSCCRTKRWCNMKMFFRAPKVHLGVFWRTLLLNSVPQRTTKSKTSFFSLKRFPEHSKCSRTRVKNQCSENMILHFYTLVLLWTDDRKWVTGLTYMCNNVGSLVNIMWFIWVTNGHVVVLSWVNCISEQLVSVQ